MSGLRDRFGEAPLWVLFTYYVVAFGGLTYLLAGPSKSVGSAAAGGLLFGALMTAYTRRTRRNDQVANGDASAPDRKALNIALRTGKLPADPSLHRPLVPLMARRHDQLRRAARLNPFVFGGFTLLSVWLAFQSLVWLIYAGLFIGFLGLTELSTRRARRRLSDLQVALDRSKESSPQAPP
jgi:hypothetical protein